MSNLKELIIKRSSVKGRVTKFKNYISKFSKSSSLDSLQIGELKIKINKFECLSSEFSELQGQIETLNADELEDELDIREELENEIDSAMSLAQDILTRFSKNFNFEYAHSSSTHQGCGGNSQGLGFKLPLIQVPRFDGSASRWMQFKEMFSSLINENSNILPIYKFHYLVSYLEGDAARVVSNLEVCALNYNKAWSLLCERYDNKRQLINSHLNALFNIEPLARESEQALRSLIDGVSKNLRALSSLGQPTDQWDTLIIYMASSKLDNQTSMKWEEHRNTLSDIPTLEQFHKFLKDRADVLESFNQHKIQNKRITSSHGVSGPSSNNNYTRNSKQNKVFSYVTQPSSNNNTNRYRTRCIVCKGNHFIYTCPSFLAKSPELRIAEAQRLQLCMNCLRSTHKTRDCLGGTCRECGKLHATILHRPTNQEPATPAQGSSDTVAAQTAVEEISVNISRQPISHVILSTVSIRVTNPKNSKSEIIRTLLDSGSQSSFLTQRVKERLNLEAIPTDINIIGIGNNTNNYVTERCFVQVSSLHSDYNTNLSCFIMPELTGNIPKAYIDRKQIDIPNHIQLADPYFYISGPVDAIIGADLFWEVIGNNIQSLGKNSPFIYNSKFGWVISGPISLNNKIKHTHCNFVSSNSLDDRLEKQISKFWEIEEMPKRSLLSDSERACEQHFQTHTTRLESGRFCVRLPLKDSPSVLGDSFSQAKKRFLNLERRFRKQPHLKQAYAAFINEYIDLGHCSELSSFTPRSGYFLCHHPIFKISESTSLRVVFDGTAPSSSGISINSLQLIGPNIQDTLFAIILRFRFYKYVLTGDIEKMFRQILINEHDRNLQLILWRDDESQPLRALRLNTVTYGFASASFLSTRCLYQLGEECPDEIIKTIIQRDFYYDDLLTGADTEAEIVHILESVQATLQAGCFNLRKFRSNLPSIFQSTNLNLADNLCLSNSTSALGLGWNPKTDMLHFSCQVPSDKTNIITKRQIISSTFKVFDPLGLLSPATIQAKILIQKLWILKVEWDQPVPTDILKEWKRIQENTDVLYSIQIPRYVISKDNVKIELHSFSDASMFGYGTCIYVKTIDAYGRSSVQLLCAKSRVAPSGKPMTIPRLELSAALLAAKLCASCLTSIRARIANCIHWCDSSVVLGWIKTSPTKLKMFVANRVAEICENTQSSSWRYVPTNLNPADLISRGIDANRLRDSTLWWNGPEFLLQEQHNWPTLNSNIVQELPELNVHSSIIEPNLIIFENHSNLTKLSRSFSYVLRFIHNCTHPNSRRTEKQSGHWGEDAWQDARSANAYYAGDIKVEL
ncbi:uncharacterized protein LOC120635903 [Pararge aegeria]|uniref:uncharacterized protein LOC120635903 n=1 Tax=Pararge aegeria TaxID=116150 RepID=UPI0019D254B0|nr:uncharacterized protein LOC120635903 [Pararge aegeria]